VIAARFDEGDQYYGQFAAAGNVRNCQTIDHLKKGHCSGMASQLERTIWMSTLDLMQRCVGPIDRWCLPACRQSDDCRQHDDEWSTIAIVTPASPLARKSTAPNLFLQAQ